MTKRIIAIIFIFICTSVAWLILGATVFSRTYNSGFDSNSQVESTWGTAQNQAPPTAAYSVFETKDEETIENGIKITKKVEVERQVQLPLEASNINVDLNLNHRQKGLLWYSTYKVAFTGSYAFRNTSDQEQKINFEL